MRRFILVFLGTILAANLIAWFGLDVVLSRLAVPGIWRESLGAFTIFQIAGTAAVVGGRLLGHQPGTGIGRPLLSCIMIWNLLLVLPTAVLVIVWLMVWQLVLAAEGDFAISALWRLAGLAAAALPFVTLLWTTLVAIWQLGRFRILRMKLTIPNLPPALKGLTIVHLSDLHIGKLTRGKVLDDMVAETNRLDADLVLLTGDLINMALEDLPKAIEMLRAMKSRHGVFSCEGNHDLIENASEFESTVKASGLKFLMNESAALSVKGQAVRLIGLRWGEGMVPNGDPASDALAQLLRAGDRDAFTILLAHNPAVFDAAAAAKIPLTLAGHTHGGQLMLSDKLGFGPWLFKYWSGLYKKGPSQMIVSNGAGNWFPLRMHAPAEFIHLTLE